MMQVTSSSNIMVTLLGSVSGVSLVKRELGVVLSTDPYGTPLLRSNACSTQSFTLINAILCCRKVYYSLMVSGGSLYCVCTRVFQ